MININRSRRGVLALGSLAIAGSLLSMTACGSSQVAPSSSETPQSWGIHASRAKIYSSIDGMTADATAVVVATPTAQRVDGNPQDAVRDPFAVWTVTTLRVDQVVSKANGVPGRIPTTTLRVGDSIDVRQLGVDSMSETPAPFLQSDSSYLLYLAAPGDGKKYSRPTFFAVGSSAGIYKAAAAAKPSTQPVAAAATAAGTTVFVSQNEDGDVIPETLAVTGDTLTPAS